MKTSPWLRWLLAAIAVSALALFAVACGDDDDSDDAGNDSGLDGGPGSDDEQDEPTEDDANPTEDDADDDDDPGNVGGSDEEEYVADFCAAFSDFGDSFTQILTDPENQDKSEEEALELFEEPFETLHNALDDIDPPGDIEEYHEALVDGIDEAIEAIRSGDPAAFDAVEGLDVEEPPADIVEKYQALADENEECVAAGGLTFGE